eukprot:scaffold9695_cov74-Skeletonema_dohrnii-CCMP3373.AAC.7
MTSSSRQHELLYFNGAGRAETIRISLHAAGINFTDTRFTGKDWPAIKPTTPLGGVSVLKVKIDDPLQALIVDEAIETLNELMAVAPKHSDPEELLKLRKEFQAGTMTKYVDFLEGLIQKNGGVGFASTSSIADLTLWGTVKMIRTGDWTGIDATFFESYVGIVATVESIAKDDKVVAYYASRDLFGTKRAAAAALLIAIVIEGSQGNVNHSIFPHRTIPSSAITIKADFTSTTPYTGESCELQPVILAKNRHASAHIVDQAASKYARNAVSNQAGSFLLNISAMSVFNSA